MRQFIVVACNIEQLVRGLGPRCRDVEPFISLNIILSNAKPPGIGQSKSNLSTDISLLGRAEIPNKSLGNVSLCCVERRIVDRVIHHPEGKLSNGKARLGYLFKKFVDNRWRTGTFLVPPIPTYKTKNNDGTFVSCVCSFAEPLCRFHPVSLYAGTTLIEKTKSLLRADIPFFRKGAINRNCRCVIAFPNGFLCVFQRPGVSYARNGNQHEQRGQHCARQITLVHSWRSMVSIQHNNRRRHEQRQSPSAWSTRS